jgi:hypothetical protein
MHPMGIKEKEVIKYKFLFKTSLIPDRLQEKMPTFNDAQEQHADNMVPPARRFHLLQVLRPTRQQLLRDGECSLPL